MTAATTDRPDTFEMVFVHNAYRQQFGALPGLVRGVADGDGERAGIVVEFFTELTRSLHHHHQAEDELMWPLLLEKAPMDSALILRMEEQHERIAELYRYAERSAATFAERPDPDRREQLGSLLDELIAALGEHLHDEEVYVLPLVERVMTVPEWEALGERGRAAIPKDRQLVFLGFLLRANTPEHGRDFLAKMPRPARVAWSVLGRRAFRKEYRRIYRCAP
ncbi:MAG TPA: hemerythrin domain-containing protein [Nakamurella sp.]